MRPTSFRNRDSAIPNLDYLARDESRRDVACLLFGAPAWRYAPRDRELGWSETERSARLHEGANNTRFLILPWVRVPHGYSAALGEWLCPARAAWGLAAYQRVSPELEARVCYTRPPRAG